MDFTSNGHRAGSSFGGEFPNEQMGAMHLNEQRRLPYVAVADAIPFEVHRDPDPTYSEDEEFEQNRAFIIRCTSNQVATVNIEPSFEQNVTNNQVVTGNIEPNFGHTVTNSSNANSPDNSNVGSTTDGSEDYYPMKSDNRGCFLIVDLQQDLSARSEVDCKRLKQLARHLGFTSIGVMKPDLGKSGHLEDLKVFLDRLGKANHKHYDCFFVALLAHKSRELHVFETGLGDEFNLECFISPYTGWKSPTLEKKPKIVVVYAPKRPSGEQEKGEEEKNGKDVTTDNCIPNHADFYISVCQPSAEFSAARPKRDGKEEGSFFIWNLCKVFTKLSSKYDICSLMTVVNKETIKNVVAIEGHNEEKLKHLYWSRSQLTKKLKFIKKVKAKLDETSTESS